MHHAANEADQCAEQYLSESVMAAYPYGYDVDPQQALCTTANGKS